jgi:hypothetical protein
MTPPDSDYGLAGNCKHFVSDEGQQLPTKGGQRRTRRLAENPAGIGELALFGMLAFAEMRYL